MTESGGVNARTIGRQGARAFSSYEFLKLIEEKGQVGFWAWDFASGAQHWSLGMCRIFGLDIDPAPSMGDFVRLIHPDDRPAQEDRLRDARHHGILPDREFRIIRPDGVMRWVSSQGEVQFSRAGQPERAFGVIFDVTALQEALRTAQRNQQRYKALSEATASIVWTAGPKGGTIDAPTWRMLTGQSYEEVQGLGWLEAVHPDDRERAMTAWRQAVEAGTVYDVRFRVRSLSDGDRWFHSRATPVRDAEGTIREWVGALVALGEEISEGANLITGAQIRAARALLRWSESDLSEAAGVSRSTIRRVEGFDDVPVGRQQNLQAIRRALEEAGVEFAFPSGRKPGVQPR